MMKRIISQAATALRWRALKRPASHSPGPYQTRLPNSDVLDPNLDVALAGALGCLGVGRTLDRDLDVALGEGRRHRLAAEHPDSLDGRLDLDALGLVRVLVVVDDLRRRRIGNAIRCALV